MPQRPAVSFSPEALARGKPSMVPKNITTSRSSHDELRRERCLRIFKIWSDDMGRSEEDAYLRRCYDIEEAVSELCDDKYHEWEYHDAPLVFFACQVDDQGRKIEDTQKVIVSVDYSPNFYASIARQGNT